MLQNQENLFNLNKDSHYLNCAYMSPMLQSVERVGKKEIERRRNPFEYGLKDFFQPLNELRQLFAALIHVPERDRIAIIPSVSYGLANAANNIIPKKKGNVIVLEGQFPSNYYIWKRLCDKSGMELITIKKPEHREEWTKSILAKINMDTAAVALPQIHWADGSRINLEKIGVRCREVDAFFVVDGTQSIGANKFDNSEIQADAVICAGYKWLMGPYGIGLAYYGPKYDDGLAIEENWLSKDKSDEFSDLVVYREQARPMASRYNVGESSNFIYVKMLIQSLTQIKVWGVENIQSYCLTITEPYMDAFRSLGCEIAPQSKRCSHLFGVKPPSQVRLEAWQESMIEDGVYTSIRGDCIRVSPNVYNDQEDISALLDSLKKLC